MTRRVLVALLVLTAVAHADVKDTIQAAYDRACVAMHYKFVDGVLSMRAPNYQSMTERGPRNAVQELRELEQALASSTTVEEATTILQCVQVNDHTVRVRVKDVLQLGRPSQVGKAKEPIIVRSTSDDTWVLIDGDWKLQSSELRTQDVDNQ